MWPLQNSKIYIRFEKSKFAGFYFVNKARVIIGSLYRRAHASAGFCLTRLKIANVHGLMRLYSL
jgi:hypothetical protein